MAEVNLPESWVLARYDDVYLSASNGTGGTQNKERQGIPVSRIETIANENIDYDRIGFLAAYDKDKVEKHKLVKGDVLFSHINSPVHLGKTAIYDGEQSLYHGINLLRIVVDRQVVLPEVFNWHCKYTRGLGEFSLRAQHAVNQSSLNQKKLGEFEIPIPPLAEQKVIAKKLDTLLAQVDNTKARLERIPDILKRFRQSVLAAAVSGKLTEEWREDNPSFKALSLNEIESYWDLKYKNIGRKRQSLKLTETELLGDIPPHWLSTKIGYVFDVFVGATPSRTVEEYWNGDLPWVSSSEVAFCRIDKTKEKITEIGLKNTSTSLHPRGTVMLAMIGQGKTRGQVAILDIEACHNQNTAALRVPEGFVVSEYLYFYLTKQYEETRRVGGGNNQQALNKSFVQSLEFPLPPYEEQAEIVRRVEELFAFADRIEQAAQAALSRVNNLTQSILAKAFRGELTADWRAVNPELISGENSAEALLTRIKSERAKLKPKKAAK